jgi:hypothetical protein
MVLMQGEISKKAPRRKICGECYYINEIEDQRLGPVDGY